MDWTSYDAALFDLDGVLTPTATVHMQAWSEIFNDFLETQEGHEPYTERDYFAYVDGKPRYDGVRSFLTVNRVVSGTSVKVVITCAAIQTGFLWPCFWANSSEQTIAAAAPQVGGQH